MIRQATYRDKKGWSVTGRNIHGQRFRIFARSLKSAQEAEEAAKRGDHKAVDRILLEDKKWDEG